MRQVVETLTNFKIDRPEMDKANTLEFLIQLAEQETDEVWDAIHNGHTEDEIASEVADCIIFLLTALIEMDRDPKEEIMTKIALNMAQHSAYFYQGEDDYNTSRLKAKEWFNDRNMRADFYNLSTEE